VTLNGNLSETRKTIEDRIVAPMEVKVGESVNRDCDEVMCVEPGGE